MAVAPSDRRRAFLVSTRVHTLDHRPTGGVNPDTAKNDEAANSGGLRNRSRTKALALRMRERRRTYRSFRNETHSTVSFPTPEHCANSLPITGIAGCCARAVSGQAAAAPPSKLMNSRRFMPVSSTRKSIVAACPRFFGLRDKSSAEVPP